MERVTRRRVVGLDLLPFISVDIPSERDRSTPTSSIFVSAFEGGNEVFRGTHASKQICGVHERTEVDVLLTRFGPREAGDAEMRQGATGRRQGGDRKTTGWRQEDDRKAAGKRQESDRKRQAGDRKATGELRQEGDRRATGPRQGGDRETTGKRQETRHSDRISDRKATGRRQEGNRASGDREATGKRQEKATGDGGGGGGRGQAQCGGGGRGNGRRRPGQHAQQVVAEVYVRRFNRMVSKVFMLVRKSPKPKKCMFDLCSMLLFHHCTSGAHCY